MNIMNRIAASAQGGGYRPPGQIAAPPQQQYMTAGYEVRADDRQPRAPTLGELRQRQNRPDPLEQRDLNSINYRVEGWGANDDMRPEFFNEWARRMNGHPNYYNLATVDLHWIWNKWTRGADRD